MPELRTDWLTGRSVLVAENRALRPNEFAVGELDVASPDVPQTELLQRTLATCPFCAGNEAQTPAAACETFDDQGNWFVRVVPNAFPAVNNLSGVTVLTAQSALAPISSNEVQSESPVAGAHEVIIESALHLERMSEIPLSHLRSC